jgi:ATP-binding cassette subfamily B protein
MKSTALIKPYFWENRYKIIIGLASLIIVDLLQLFIPRIIKWAVDGLTALQIDLTKLLVYASYMIVIALFIGVFRYVWRRCLLGTSRRVEEGLRNRLFAHIQNLSASYFDHIKTGDLMAHATNDIQQVRMATGMGMVALNDAVVLGTAAIGFMLYINVRLTLFVLIPMPLIVFGARFFSKKMHRRYQAVQASFSDLTEVVRERFAGIRIIKAHNRKKEEAAKVRAISKTYIDKKVIFPADASFCEFKPGHRTLSWRPADDYANHHTGRFRGLHQLSGIADLADDGPGLGHQSHSKGPGLVGPH